MSSTTKCQLVLSILVVYHGVASGSGEGEAAQKERRLRWCARLLDAPADVITQNPNCRDVLFEAFHRDRIPGYSYDASSREQCWFWAHFGLTIWRELASASLSVRDLVNIRLEEDFVPHLRDNGLALYVGAHRKARDAAYLQRKYKLRMHIFEPSPAFFASLQKEYSGREHFTLHNYGLGAATREETLFQLGEASSMLDPGSAAVHSNRSVKVQVHSASEAVNTIVGSLPSKQVDLLHMNCESCEYDVIRALDDAGLMSLMSHIQFQSHILDWPGAALEDVRQPLRLLSVQRYCQTHEILKKTHKRIWGLPWLWERWTLIAS